MAFGDEFRHEETVSDREMAKTRTANGVRWNEAAGQLLALKGVLDLQTKLGVAILTSDAEFAIRLAFAGDPETVGYLENYPYRFGVSDRRTIATEGLLDGILEVVRSGVDQQLADAPQA